MTSNGLGWSELLHLYRNARWIEDDDADVTVVDRNLLDTLRLIETSDRAALESDIVPLASIETVSIGAIVRMRIGAPQWRLGTLARDWDALLRFPLSRVKERPEYYLTSDGTHGGTTPPSEPMLRYRAMLRFVELVGRAALFCDWPNARIVFFDKHRIDLPVTYEWKDVLRLDMKELDLLETTLAGDVHADQRLAILADAVTSLVDGRPTKDRFRYLVQNVGELAQKVVDGYRLFAASFSYSKIRTEVDKGVSEYVGRIHKTFADIQGQLLGLPVATVVVATQLKPVRSCTLEAFSNTAVLAGALLFCVLLLASCVNQWFTLRSIRGEIDEQRRRLVTEFREIEDLFAPSFQALRTRIGWHRAALVAIAAITVVSSGFAYYAFAIAGGSQAWRCMGSGLFSL
ncbi:hypothetical protein [Aureimonas sp. AU4]|uniref:hypothetical protein n=1 Tax=Aureimonas sp. AU4 TaxID=1638163 RepID=UPI000782FFE3|nr:hypothetical protein [Aureimonas sp. AU4]